MSGIDWLTSIQNRIDEATTQREFELSHGVDWAESPEGAMRFKKTNNGHRWLKKVSESIFFYECSEWHRYGNQTIGLNHWNNATPRPVDTHGTDNTATQRVDWSKAPKEATHALRYVDGSIDFGVLVGDRYQTVDTLGDYFIVEDKQWQVIEARLTITTDDVDDTVTQRGERYGLFADGAVIMQDLKAVMRATPGWERLTPSQREALEMIQHKIGRVLNGDPTYDDNWRDIAGYSTLILNELDGVKR